MWSSGLPDPASSRRALDRSNLDQATETRERFEKPWNRFNALRSWLHGLGFVCMCWALIAFGAL